MSASLPFSCPDCGAALKEKSNVLTCASGHSFDVTRGVPRFVAGADYTDSFGRQWNHWATTQMDSVNGTSIFAERFARYFCPPEELSGLRVLDAGCGVGAFIDVVSPHADEVVGFDLSSAVESAQANVGGRENVSIAQADIFNPPLEPESFDLVYCIGVIQHTPDPERAFESLSRLVRPGGRLAVWIYDASRWEALKPRHLLRHYTSRHLRPRPCDALRRGIRSTRPACAPRDRSRSEAGGCGRLIPVADPHDYAGRDHRSTRRRADRRVVRDGHPRHADHDL